MKALGAAVMGGGVWRRELMLNTRLGTPFRDLVRKKLPVVSGEDFKTVATLVLNYAMPRLEGWRRFVFGLKRDHPDITGKVIDDIHGVEMPSFGGDRHRTTKVDKNPPQPLGSPNPFRAP
jgi:hypothetical protein